MHRHEVNIGMAHILRLFPAVIWISRCGRFYSLNILSVIIPELVLVFYFGQCCQNVLWILICILHGWVYLFLFLSKSVLCLFVHVLWLRPNAPQSHHFVGSLTKAVHSLLSLFSLNRCIYTLPIIWVFEHKIMLSHIQFFIRETN